MPNENSIINPEKYCCKICDYNTVSIKDYNKHLITRKHKILTNPNDTKSCVLSCKCGKTYKHASSLCNHKKKCKFLINSDVVDKYNETNDKDLIMMLLKQNTQLITQNSELIKTSNGPNINNNNTNSNNKTFNLNFFLNDTCKDAMNIADFINSIKLQLSDLENVGKLGYVEGVSNIIVKNLNGLDVAHRPVHCTDKKRDTLYVKDNDIWEKDEEKIQIKKVIAKITDKNKLLLPSFKQAHPSYSNSMSPFSDQYNQILIETLGGSGDKEEEKECKIIKNISKVTCLERI